MNQDARTMHAHHTTSFEPTPTPDQPIDPGHRPWFHAHKDRAFPLAALPAHLTTYVQFEAARFGVDEAVVAVTALARLGGTLVENRGVPSLSGHPVPLLLRVLMAVPPGLGLTAAIRESGRAVEAIQAQRLQVATGLDHKRIQELRDSPQFRLPDYAVVPGGDPREVTKARHHALDVLRRPAGATGRPKATSTRLKLLKRQRHGRARFDLLRRRLPLAS